MKIKIQDIVINKRIREAVGDITQLKQSMKERGIINPVVIDRKNTLIAGYRRIMAARELGWDSIECRIIDAPTELQRVILEADENLGRKDFTAGELKKYKERKEYLEAGKVKRIKLNVIKFFNGLKEWLMSFFTTRQ